MILREDYLKHITTIIENTRVRKTVIESIKFTDSNFEEMKHILETSELLEIRKLKLNTGECRNIIFTLRSREPSEHLNDFELIITIDDICCNSHEDLIILRKLFSGNFWYLKGNQYDWMGRRGLQLSNMRERDWTILTELCDPHEQNISSVNISKEDLLHASLRQICKLWENLVLKKLQADLEGGLPSRQFLIDGIYFSFEEWTLDSSNEAVTSFDKVLRNMNIVWVVLEKISPRNKHKNYCATLKIVKRRRNSIPLIITKRRQRRRATM